MAAVSTALFALTAAKGTMDFMSDRRNAKAAQQQGEYEAATYGLNADLADQAADDAIARGKEAAAKSKLKTRQLKGMQRATLAAQGLELDTGSASDLQLETGDLGELDVLTIANNAAREAFGFKVEAMNYRRQADLALLGGSNKSAAYKNQSISTLLTTGASLADQYQRRK